MTITTRHYQVLRKWRTDGRAEKWLDVSPPYRTREEAEAHKARLLVITPDQIFEVVPIRIRTGPV